MQGTRISDLLVKNAFYLVLAAALIFFTAMTENFLQVQNFLNILHTMAPLAIVSAGLAVVVIAGQLDISVGSIAFLSCATGGLLMQEAGWHPVPAFLVILLTGVCLGAVNGLIVTVLQVNPLITTLGTMIAFRGVALALTDAVLVELPEPMRILGHAEIGPVPTDIVIMVIVLAGVHALHARTTFGRWIVAMGNDAATARKIGLPVDRTAFLGFVLAGFLAALGGSLSMIQNGAVSPFLGAGMEFSALAIVVVGGISLLGGRGTIFLSILSGAFIFEMIRNGLTNLGANPYSYRLVGGAVIFAAMYADALKSKRV